MVSSVLLLTFFGIFTKREFLRERGLSSLQQCTIHSVVMFFSSDYGAITGVNGVKLDMIAWVESS